MSLLAIYSSPTTPGGAGWSEDVTGAIRLGSITGLAGEAEMGAVGEGNVVLDDTDGTVGHSSDGIVGLKQFFLNELDCPIGNQRLWTGYVGDRRYRRGQNDSLITGVARKIDVTLFDTNSFLSFRVFAPVALDPTSSFDRPAEGTRARIAALLAVDFISDTLYDIGYIPTTGGVDLDANDYTGSRPVDVLNDIAQANKWNFFVLYDEASGHLVLWMDDWKTDGTATKTYDSPLQLTNVLSEHDGSTTFAIEPDAEGVLDPSRVISAEYLPFDGGTSYGTNPTTANTFAWRDAVAPSINVKTQAKADAIVLADLVQNSTEDERISCTVQLPSNKVTSIHEGMRIQVHFTHIPNVQSAMTWCRILQRTIRQDVETTDFYWLDLELTPIIIPPTVTPQAILYLPNSYPVDGSGTPVQVYFASTGTHPATGWTPYPTVGPITENAVGSPPYGNANWSGWTFANTGASDTIDLAFTSTFAGVPVGTETYTLTILMNGTSVATATGTWGANGSAFNATFTAVPVPAGATMTMSLSWTPNTGRILHIPAGDGQNTHLEITGGTLTP